MSITRHAPDTLHKRETLCGQALTGVGVAPHWLAGLGDSVNCPQCRIVVNMALRCLSPHRFILVKTP